MKITETENKTKNTKAKEKQQNDSVLGTVLLMWHDTMTKQLKETLQWGLLTVSKS